MKQIKWIGGTGIVIFLLLYPKIAGIYYTNLFLTFGIFAVYSVSFNLLLGYTGLFSFGHAMFFGVGGYGTALALKHISGIPLLLAVLAGILSAAVFALLLCPIVIRVSGAAFAMLHLAFGQLIFVMALKLRSITGGEDGIGGFPIPPFNIPGLISVDMKDPTNFYYFSLIILGASLGIMWFFTKTPFGQVIVGIRDNAKRIDYLGYKVPESKAVVYTISGAFAGAAGSIFAIFQNLISAGALGILTSFAPIVNTLIGGMGSFFGPVWGTAIMEILLEITTRYTERVELVQGVILIFIIMFFPRGFVGLLEVAKRKYFLQRSTK